MDYSTYFISYYIIGCVVCIYYLVYKMLTAKANDDIDETGFFTLMLFFFWLIVVPIVIFIWVKKKLLKLFKEYHNILHKKDKELDVEKKQLVDWKWNPNKGDYYYYISSLGKVIRTNYLDTDADKSSFDFGNCFCTEEEANTMAKKIKKLLKGEEL